MKVANFGAVSLRYLNDVDSSTIASGRVLTYSSATNTFIFVPAPSQSLYQNNYQSLISDSTGTVSLNISGLGLKTLDGVQVTTFLYQNESLPITNRITQVNISSATTSTVDILCYRSSQSFNGIGTSNNQKIPAENVKMFVELTGTLL